MVTYNIEQKIARLKHKRQIDTAAYRDCRFAEWASDDCDSFSGAGDL
jgi:hypothetical protein